MRRHGGYYDIFLHPEKEDNQDIKKRLLSLSKMEVSICYPLLLKLFSAYEKGQYNENVLSKCLSIIESMILRRTVCDEKRSALNKLFIRLASKFITVVDPDKWLESELLRTVRSERWPEDEEFTRALINNPIYGEKGIRLVLERIETVLAGKEVIDLSNKKITIEHIMPQQLTEEWKEMLGANYFDIHKQYLDTAGNLTLTAYNSELGNLPFSEKKKKFLESGIALNRIIANEDVWGQEQILKRAKFLADEAKKLWRRPVAIS